MSDLPERIWAFPRVKMTDGTWYGDWHSNETELFSEYLRADTLPSREKLLVYIEAFEVGVISSDQLADTILNRLKGADHD